jgi:RNA polymerase sigma factor (sigma-70 family)
MANPSLEMVLEHLRQLFGAQAVADLSDGQLLKRFIDTREDAAFAALMRRHGPMVLSVCRRILRHGQDAEDAFQATFLVLARKAAAISKRESVGSWLHGVAYRLAHKARAERERRRQQEPRAERTPPTSPLCEAAWRELQAVLDEELARLPEKYRAPLLLCYLEGQTHDQTARQLGLPVGTVHTRLSRGRELLRVRLTRRGLELSATAFATSLAANTTTAALPAGLFVTTVKSAQLFSVGNAAAAGVSGSVAALAEGALKAILMAKVKTTMLVLIAGVLVAGAGALTQRGWVTHPPEAQLPVAQQSAPLRPVGQSPPAPECPPSIDRFGDPLPAGAVARLGTIRFRSPARSYLTFSPDGALLASGVGDTITLWDPTTGKEIRHCVGHPGVGWLTFSLDGTRLFSGGDDRVIRTWDVATARILTQFSVPNSNIRFAFAPDRKTVACGCNDGTVRLWDLATGREVRCLIGHQGRAHRVAFSADGSHLASTGHDKTVRLWRLSDGVEVGRIDGNRRGVGERLGNEGFVDKLIWSRDGKVLITGGPEEALHRWEVATGEYLGPLGATPRTDGDLRHRLGIFDLACSRDGKFLVSCSYGAHVFSEHVLVWDLEKNSLAYELKDMGGVNRVTICPDDKTLATGGNADISLWDLATGQPRNPVVAPRGAMYAACFSPDGRILATGGGDALVRLWDTTRWTELRRLKGSEGAVFSLAFSNDGTKLATVGVERDVCVWDLASGKEVFRYHDPDPDNRVRHVVFAPDGRRLATCGLVFDVASGAKLCETPGPKYSRPAFLPDGQMLILGEKKELYEFDPDTGKVIHGTDPRTEYRFAYTFSVAGSRRLAFGGPKDEVILWDLDANRRLRQFVGPKGFVWTLSLSPDGRTVASAHGEDFRVHLWEVATGKERRHFGGHRETIRAMLFSPDGKQLVSTSVDTSALVWDVTAPLATGPSDTRPLTPDQLERQWTEMGDADAVKAYEAMCSLIARPQQTVAFLTDRLSPVDRGGSAEILRFLGDLESVQFGVRQTAEQALERMGERAERDLRQALEKKPTLETRKRLEGLLEKLAGPVTNPERLRELRAVEILEYIGTRDARQILEMLSRGDSKGRLTWDAQESLKRLAKRPAHVR